MRRSATVTCAYCGEQFTREVRHLNENTKHRRQNYCSPECKRSSQMTAVSIPCAVCGTTVDRTPSQRRRSRSGRVFCSRSCSNAARNHSYAGRRHPNYRNGDASYRETALREHGPLCAICGYNITQVLEVHHIDGDRTNNDVENLKVLCPTHHTEVHLGIRVGV